jgi:trans-2,3-dihydro-3-hydroxyanthranilate isomerase
MQRVAREVNLSETTFPTVVDDSRYDNRIFTPYRELAFAGHPSLGSAWVLGPNRWTQVTRGASITVVADESGARMTAPETVLTEIDATGLVAALGLPRADGAYVAEAGIRHAIVATDAPIEELYPDLRAVAAAVETDTVAVVRRRDDNNLHVRVYAPGAGIAEDPGTGSAAGAYTRT